MPECTKCPKDPFLPDIPPVECPIDWDQIVRLAFSRPQPSGAPQFPDVLSIQALANWQTFFAAVDDTKIVVTPPTPNTVIPQSEAQTEGGNSNETINGVTRYLGEGSVEVSGEILSLDDDTAEAIRALSCEPNLIVWMFNRFDQVIYKDLVDDGNGANGFPLTNFRLSTVGTDGFNAKNKYAYTFQFDGRWDEKWGVADVDFNVLTDI